MYIFCSIYFFRTYFRHLYTVKQKKSSPYLYFPLLVNKSVFLRTENRVFTGRLVACYAPSLATLSLLTLLSFLTRLNPLNCSLCLTCLTTLTLLTHSVYRLPLLTHSIHRRAYSLRSLSCGSVKIYECVHAVNAIEGNNRDFCRH